MLRLPLLLLLAPLSVLTRPTLSPRAPPSIRTIHAFSDFTLENLAPRSNGHLLLTASQQNFLYDIDPTASSPSPSALPSIPGVVGVLGIAETSQDVFAVAVGNYSLPNFTATPGSFGIWRVDMTTAEPTVNLITQIPDAQALNGMVALNGLSGSVLVADSQRGAVWKVDVATGAHSIIIQDDHFAPPAGEPFGINGVRLQGENLYFTNSGKGTFGYIPINGDGSARGSVTILATLSGTTGTYDDFDLSGSSNAYIATHSSFVYEVTAGGSQSDMGSSFTQPTSARFGRGSQVGTLYVVNSGNGPAGGAQIDAVTGFAF